MDNRKSIIVKLGLLSAMLLIFATYSFVAAPGGDHFEVYLNKQLVLQQIVSQPSGIKSVALDQSNLDDKVNVYYSHCGKIGTRRSIVIKEGNNVLKHWRFSDAAGNTNEKKFMSVNARDILAFKAKGSDKKVNLYYSSAEIPDGRLLASIILSTSDKRVEP